MSDGIDDEILNSKDAYCIQQSIEDVSFVLRNMKTDAVVCSGSLEVCYKYLVEIWGDVEVNTAVIANAIFFWTE